MNHLDKMPLLFTSSNSHMHVFMCTTWTLCGGQTALRGVRGQTKKSPCPMSEVTERKPL